MFVYKGSAGGLGNEPWWILDCGIADCFFGTVAAVAGAGDVNGDGYDDVIVGAPGFDGVEADDGKAFIYFGGPWGLSFFPGWDAEGNLAQGDFGHSAAGVGDVDGDGFADVIVGAPSTALGAADEGRACAYYGGPPGELVADFGSNGLWHYRKSLWTLLNAADAQEVVYYGRSIFVDFGAYGLYAYTGGGWMGAADLG